MRNDESSSSRNPQMTLHVLEPDAAEQRAWLKCMAQAVLTHLENVPSSPAAGPPGMSGLVVADDVSVPISEDPLPGGFSAAVTRVMRASEPALNTASPGYMAYVPAGGLFTAALAEFLASVLNRYTGIAEMAPALVRLESDVLTWLAKEFGFGPEAAGLFTSGGSLATFTAVVTARAHCLPENMDLRTAVAYTSTQAHHSVARSLAMAGLPISNVRALDVDERYRLDPKRLQEAIRRDRTQGLQPFLVVGSAGTTNTGAIDPLSRLADICAEERMWLHVDAAYGGAFVLCQDGRTRLQGIELADSVTLDPHKGMFLPYGTGCLLVREGSTLRAAYRAHGHYLRDVETDRREQAMSPSEHGPELTRPYRGLRLWLPLMVHGARAFRESLAEKLRLTDLLHERLNKLARDGLPLEIVDRPQLTVVPFRMRRLSGETLEEWNRRNELLLEKVNLRQRVHLSSTVLPVSDGEATTLRVCILSFRTHVEQIEMCIEDIAAASRQIAVDESRTR